MWRGWAAQKTLGPGIRALSPLQMFGPFRFGYVGTHRHHTGCNSSRMTRRNVSSIVLPRIASRKVALMSVW